MDNTDHGVDFRALRIARQDATDRKRAAIAKIRPILERVPIQGILEKLTTIDGLDKPAA